MTHPTKSDALATEDANRAIVAAAFENWKQGKGNIFLDLLTEQASWTIAGASVASRTYASRAEFMDDVIKPFNARLTRGLVPTVKGLYAEGDAVIILFDAEAVARDGQPYRNSYAWFFTMSGGKVVTATAFFDSIVFDDFWRRVSPAG